MSSIINSEDEREIRKEQITLLVTSYYDKLEFLHYESLDLLVQKALDLFLDTDLTIDEINEKLMEAIVERKRELDQRYDSEEVKKNHETIYGKLEQLANELNKAGIDYQLAGALCGYIKYGEESDRCHDDIDICLNEEDMDKFQEICERLGLSFEDNRFNSPRVLRDGIPHGEHEVIARDPGSDFHIGVFPFERKKDGSVVMKGYYHDDDGKPCVREEEYSPELAREIFDQEEVDFRGTPLRITPPEHIYGMKKYTHNQKDQHDIIFLDSRIDQTKRARIQALSRTDKNVRFVPASTINLTPVDAGIGGELDSMFAGGDIEQSKIEDHDSSKGKEGAKMLVKKAQESPATQQTQQQSSGGANNSDGFISNLIITTLALITFVLCFIGIALIYLVQIP